MGLWLEDVIIETTDKSPPLHCLFLGMSYNHLQLEQQLLSPLVFAIPPFLARQHQSRKLALRPKLQYPGNETFRRRPIGAGPQRDGQIGAGP